MPFNPFDTDAVLRQYVEYQKEQFRRTQEELIRRQQIINPWDVPVSRNEETMPTKPSSGGIITREALNKLTLPDDTKDEIISVMKQYEKRDVLMNDWGLSEVIEYGFGMVFLFWGPPGTGKTYTARLIAQAVGRKLSIIGSGELESQVPGEFERKCKALFEKARRDQEIILFDECDGMIQSRFGMGQIMSSQNNTILTEIEKHDGVVFMTTNRVDTLDEALERRISVIIEFKAPTFDERTEIWKKHIPSKLPLGTDVSLKKLAEYNLTGGQIKNVVLNAARFAIGRDSKKVTLIDFEKAVRRVQEGSKAFTQPRKTGAHQFDRAKMIGDQVIG